MILLFLFGLIVLIVLEDVYRHFKNRPTYTQEELQEEIAKLNEELREKLNELNEVNSPPKLKKPIVKYKDSTINLLNLVLHKSTMFISAEAKRIYLNSAEWWKLRDQRMVLAGYKCECCGSTWMLQCHHIDYSMLTKELIEHLRILCIDCHQYQHDIYGYDRKTFYYPIVKQQLS